MTVVGHFQHSFGTHHLEYVAVTDEAFAKGIAFDLLYQREQWLVAPWGDGEDAPLWIFRNTNYGGKPNWCSLREVTDHTTDQPYTEMYRRAWPKETP